MALTIDNLDQYAYVCVEFTTAKVAIIDTQAKKDAMDADAGTWVPVAKQNKFGDPAQANYNHMLKALEVDEDSLVTF